MPPDDIRLAVAVEVARAGDDPVEVPDRVDDAGREDGRPVQVPDPVLPRFIVPL